jgi:glycerophosphoryl diester phosphodiesterase
MNILTPSLLTSSYIYAIAPHKKGNLCSERIYGHRGLYDNHSVYENSLEAFDACIKKGIGIELDIKLTCDNKVIVYHDDDSKRFDGNDKPIHKRTYAELSTMPYKVATLKEALDHINGQVPIMIEFKTDYCDPVLLCRLAYKTLKDYHGTYCIKSFDYRNLLWFRINHPEVARGLLVSKRYSTLTDFLSTWLLINIVVRPDFVSCRLNCTKRPSVVLYRKLLKGKVAAWTIKDESEFEDKLKRFDMLIYDPQI